VIHISPFLDYLDLYRHAFDWGNGHLSDDAGDYAYACGHESDHANGHVYGHGYALAHRRANGCGGGHVPNANVYFGDE
jgi:hypothetical protein